MDGSADPIGASEPLSEAAIARLMAHPRFREACLASARGGIAHYLALNEDQRWLLKDIGRLGICIAAAVLDLSPGGLTAQALVAACAEGGLASTGRVNEMLRRLEQSGSLTADDGPALRTRRRLHVTRSFADVLRRRLLVELHALEALSPGVVAVASRVTDDQAFVRYVLQVASVAMSRRELFSFGAAPIVEFFLHREAGMLMLYDLMVRMPNQGGRLLSEPACLSRNALASRYGISRAHINKLLADAAGRGYLTLEGRDSLVFAPAVSEAIERFFGLMFELLRTASAQTARVMAPALEA